MEMMNAFFWLKLTVTCPKNLSKMRKIRFFSANMAAKARVSFLGTAFVLSLSCQNQSSKGFSCLRLLGSGFSWSPG
jgi:hypothetical protein